LGVAPVAVFSAVTSPAPASLDDTYFGWDARELSVSDAQAAIRQVPKLAAFEALIIDRCGLHSINPRLATLLLEASGTLDDIAPDVLDQIKARIDSFLGALPHVYYLGRHAAAKRQTSALQYESTMPTAAESAGLDALAETFLRGENRSATLAVGYIARFGERTRLLDVGPQHKAGAITPAANPPNWMRLPWLLGQQGWSFNGVHSSSGSCPNPVCAQPRSSIDFSNGWPVWGTNTTRSPVLAAIDGTVTVYSSCQLRITNANGWATNYYHLANIRVTNGSSVFVGQNLADFADNQLQALCQLGSSTGPHVHFMLVNAGAQVNIDQSDFSGWKINATNVIADYDSNCTRMNLTRAGSTACAYNNGSVPAAWSMHSLATGMASNKMCDLDIDGNTLVDTASDGVLLLRYLLGMRGDTLIAGVPVAGTPRNTAALIEQFIASKRYDLDGDNATSSYGDGLLAVRLMRGLTGTALSGGATTSTSLLTTGAQISALAAGCR
jgi:LasA protease